MSIMMRRGIRQTSSTHLRRRVLVTSILLLGALVLYLRDDNFRISPLSFRSASVDRVRDRMNAAPRLDKHAVPISESLRSETASCGPNIGRRPSRRYALPSGHPRAAIGRQIYRNAETCLTYTDRYASYDGPTFDGYLNDYYEGVQAHKEVKIGQRASDLQRANRQEDVFDWQEAINACTSLVGSAKRALVLRSYENYTWGHDDVRNVRALISELALTSDVGRRHDVFIFVEVHSPNTSFAMSDDQRLRILLSSVPREFWSITELWSEEEMAWLFPGLSGTLKNHMSPVSSYRSCFMPLQAFARHHSQYDFIWNWEMDTRSTHDYGSVLHDVERYASTARLDATLDRQSEWQILGDEDDSNSIPKNANNEMQEADLITLNPIFNVDKSGFYWEYDFQNMPADTLKRGSVGKNVRLSRRLLEAMTKANVDEKMSSHCEFFPATILLHEQRRKGGMDHSAAWKGVYVPHPVYTTHVWRADELDKAVNKKEIYKKVNEKVLRDVSFYYDGGHAKVMYDAWRNDSLVCRSPSLLHPVKRQK